jgi:hypothetical protein
MVGEVTHPAELAECYGLLARTYRAAQVPLADRSLLEAAFEELHPRGEILITVARLGAIPVATSIELLYRDAVYGWYSGMDRSHGSHYANEMLMWYVLKWSAERRFMTLAGRESPTRSTVCGTSRLSSAENSCAMDGIRLFTRSFGFA